MLVRKSQIRHTNLSRAQQCGRYRFNFHNPETFFLKTSFLSEIKQIHTKVCFHLGLKIRASGKLWHVAKTLQNHTVLPHSYMQQMLFYRISFFHLWWTPRVQSKQFDLVHLPSSLILLPLHKPLNGRSCQKKHGFDISSA